MNVKKTVTIVLDEDECALLKQMCADTQERANQTIRKGNLMRPSLMNCRVLFASLKARIAFWIFRRQFLAFGQSVLSLAKERNVIQSYEWHEMAGVVQRSVFPPVNPPAGATNRI